MTSLVSMLGVSKVYGSPVPFTALREASLTVDAGQTVAVVGPSGSGKTTLLGILGGLERPTRGVVRILGDDLAALTDAQVAGIRAHRIGFVFQRFHLIEQLSVLENVATGLLYQGASASSRRRAARAALDRVGLAPRASERVSHLSGGERQRVAIARAVVGHPNLILADEPTGNLDSVTGAGVMDLLTGLADAETGVVVVTHDVTIAARLDRTVTVQDGEIVDDTRRSP